MGNSLIAGEGGKNLVKFVGRGVRKAEQGSTGYNFSKIPNRQLKTFVNIPVNKYICQE